MSQMGDVRREQHVDPFREVRHRASQRMTQDLLSKLKPDDKELAPESHNPYTIGNVLWLTSALIVFRLAEVPEALLYDPRKNSLYFLIGIMLGLVSVGICLFCVVWLSIIKKVDSSQWEKLYPSAIPVATVSFISAGLFMTIGLWPIWRYLTPVIIFVLFMGFVVLVAMIPNWGPVRGSTEKQSPDEHMD